MSGVPELPSRLLKEAEDAARAVRRAGSVLVVSHIDADGITAGSIAAETLRRLGKRYRVCFVKKIADDTIDMINGAPEDLVWICDLGSAYMSLFTRDGVVVTDHHVPDPRWRRGQASLFEFNEAHQLNPHYHGCDGSYEVCGAGMTYLLSRTLDPSNTDMAYLAVIGAVGDFQDDREGRLVGWNRVFLTDAIAAGDVSIDRGLRFFGRESRALSQFIELGEDPRVPGVAGDRKACSAFLKEIGIPEEVDGVRRTWFDLTDDEKDTLVEAIRAKVGDGAGRLVCEVYSVNRYPPKSGIHDVKEFSTVLNSCGRYDDAETGSRLCLGDVSALEDAERNRRAHRRNISVAMSYVRDNHLIRRRSNLQYFDVGDAVRETVVGIVAGMVLNSDIADHGLPIFAFAEADDGVKVSARAPRELVDEGLDLSLLMHDCAEAVGGLGGGHSVAAGATIPEGAVDAFLDAVDARLAEWNRVKKKG